MIFGERTEDLISQASFFNGAARDAESKFQLMEFCVCSLRGDIRELAANPASELMQTFALAVDSHRQHRPTPTGRLDERRSGDNFSSSVVSLSACQTEQAGRQETLPMEISDVKR